MDGRGQPIVKISFFQFGANTHNASPLINSNNLISGRVTCPGLLLTLLTDGPERCPSSREVLVTTCCDPEKLKGSCLGSLLIGSKMIYFCQVFFHLIRCNILVLSGSCSGLELARFWDSGMLHTHPLFRPWSKYRCTRLSGGDWLSLLFWGDKGSRSLVCRWGALLLWFADCDLC